jgi:hypothetical protein
VTLAACEFYFLAERNNLRNTMYLYMDSFATVQKILLAWRKPYPRQKTVRKRGNALKGTNHHQIQLSANQNQNTTTCPNFVLQFAPGPLKKAAKLTTSLFSEKGKANGSCKLPRM